MADVVKSEKPKNQIEVFKLNFKGGSFKIAPKVKEDPYYALTKAIAKAKAEQFQNNMSRGVMKTHSSRVQQLKEKYSHKKNFGSSDEKVQNVDLNACLTQPKEF